jgi:hypothetical protein
MQNIRPDLRGAAWFDGDLDAFNAPEDVGQVTEFLESGLGPSRLLSLRLSSGRPAALVARDRVAGYVEVWLLYEQSFLDEDLLQVASVLGISATRLIKMTGSLRWRSLG